MTFSMLWSHTAGCLKNFNMKFSSLQVSSVCSVNSDTHNSDKRQYLSSEDLKKDLSEGENVLNLP